MFIIVDNKHLSPLSYVKKHFKVKTQQQQYNKIKQIFSENIYRNNKDIFLRCKKLYHKK